MAPFPSLQTAASWPGAVLLACAVNLAAGVRLPDALAGSAGKRVALHVTDLDLRVCFEIGEHGMRARPALASSDVTISACAADFAALARRSVDPDTLFFTRRLLIEGDTELGLIVKNTLDALPYPGVRDLAPPRLFAALRTCLFG
ncbi:MAG TPA: SCP2 sterol-binding domain-containing protein [Burkholderiales bacterium]|nr:SCP2 sterol-binding domain-containing protein [Burkholderiales bacterium]